MAKYDAQLTELKNLLPNVKNILIALPAQADIDELAGALALFLSLKAAVKEVLVVSDETIRVAQAHLFGIDHVQKNIPPTEGGNFIITLGGVAVSDTASPSGWKVPALQSLDWHGEAGNLNLVFHVVPGQTFAPTSVTPHAQGSGFNLIFVVGSPDLNSLGGIYQQNQQAFSGVHIVNIDNQIGNTGFGSTNVLDQSASSVSEIMADLIPSLSLPFDGDTASNILAGIFDATSNLTTASVGADTFAIVANCLRVGGKKPGVQPAVQSTPQPTPGFDLSALMPAPPRGEPKTPESIVPPPVISQNLAPETPVGEAVTPGTEIEAEPDWLTPKVFKGG